jgi:hypothetical protein
MKLSDKFKQFHNMVKHQLRCMPGPGAALEVIEEWGKEFVEYFVSICLCLLSDAKLMFL